MQAVQIIEDCGCCQQRSGSGSGGGGPPIDGCSCPCCVSGIWSEFTLNATGIVAILGGCDECDLFNGEYILHFRGKYTFGTGPSALEKCVWSSDETYEGDCEGTTGCFLQISDPCPKWTLTLEDNPSGGCLWTLRGAFGAVLWAAYMEQETVGAVTLPAQPDFCEEGGTLARFVADIGENTCTGPTTLEVNTSGVFVPC